MSEVARPKRVCLGTRIPIELDAEINRVVKKGRYLNKADFIRSAVRSELEKARQEKTS